jgi:hypothetical protein
VTDTPNDDSPRDRDRDRDVGQGYPEEAPPGTGIDARDHAEQEIDGNDAADTTKPADSDPGAATGNPRAAGG